MRTALACAAIALIVSVFVIGCSKDSDDEAQPQTTVSVAPAPVDTLPTSETVKLAIFERAYSECASTEPDRLAAKYKLVNTTDPVLALGVARAWVKYFDGGKDAVPEGQAGCLEALREEK